VPFCRGGLYARPSEPVHEKESSNSGSKKFLWFFYVVPVTMSEHREELSPSPAGRFGGYGLFLAVVAVVVVLDLLTKEWILRSLPLYSQKEILPGFFNLVHVRNPGVAFSFFAGGNNPWRSRILAGLAVAALGMIFFLYRQCSAAEWEKRLALSLIAGGALGNLGDRLRFGEVVDFLDFYVGPYHWPAFNVADMAVTAGAGLLLYTMLRQRPSAERP
jgi:signal peptidase II